LGGASLATIEQAQLGYRLCLRNHCLGNRHAVREGKDHHALCLVTADGKTLEYGKAGYVQFMAA
jgi:hypothetical protein